jgi:cell division protease FtsH
VLLLILWLWQEFVTGVAVQTIDYSEFKRYLAQGEVKKVELHANEVTGMIQAKPPADAGKPDAAPPAAEKDQPHASDSKQGQFQFRSGRNPGDDPSLVAELQKQGIPYRFVQPNVLSTVLFAWVLPIGVFALLWFFLFRRIGSAGQAVMGIGKSRARMAADRDTRVTFADVAGCDEAKYELQEVVDFLKNPARYQALGAKIPKGILLVGPPGTGKTLMARAVAGEAHVPFFSISGSDFVEMFVGVGAARVRDMFEQAKAHAPCIIFIDELDAIGRQRGVHLGPVNDEREQTLNQLLVEMDGFEANAGIIILAATNRPDVLDRALLRPGRFDRQVVVDAPDIDGREAILKVHARGKPLAPGVRLRAIAQATAGFSGADLANALNEAALLAARRGATQITQRDLEEAVEKVVAGPERSSRRLDPEQKRRVAYHEVGHALVAAFSKYADPVHKISVVPRGRAALGYTLQLPAAEQFIMTRSALVDRLKGLLGGRAAEELVFNEVSTGAENDLERATELARQMVCMFGMSEMVGLLHCANKQAEYLSGPTFGPSRDWSEATTRQVDHEVKRILEDAYEESLRILREHRDQLETVAQELLKRESLDAATFHELIGLAYTPEPALAEEPVLTCPPGNGEG